MGLFDILNNSVVQEQLKNLSGKTGIDFGGLAGKAMSGMSNMASKVPGNIGGLAGAGALGALLGSLMPKGATKAASVLGLGVVAYSFYKKWAAGQNQTPQAFTETDFQKSFASEPVSTLLLRTMVYAAKADGHIDATERARIEALVPQLFPGQNVQHILEQVLSEEPNLTRLTEGLTGTEQGEDLYRLSCMIMDVDHFAERGYLAELGRVLGLTAQRMQELEAEAEAAKQQLNAF